MKDFDELSLATVRSQVFDYRTVRRRVICRIGMMMALMSVMEVMTAVSQEAAETLAVEGTDTEKCNTSRSLKRERDKSPRRVVKGVWCYLAGHLQQAQYKETPFS